MDKQSALRLTLYLVSLCVITVGVYIAVHVFFKEPFSDPFFSSITPLQNTLKKEAALHPLITPSPVIPRPTVPPIQETEKNKYVIHRFNEDPRNPVYIVRGRLAGPVVEADKTIQGTFVIVSDPQQRKYKFILKGNGRYTVGVYKGGFGDFANTLESHTGHEIVQMFSPDSPVQLRIATSAYSLEERDLLVSAIEKPQETNATVQNLTLRAFEIGVMR
jgi:hypothetical protein